ncbi:MAG TPA: hypothetical protein VGI37_13415 [Streptosporangiaceae bacterium]
MTDTTVEGTRAERRNTSMVKSPTSTDVVRFRPARHPAIRSYEPGENGYWGYVDQFAFELGAALAVPSHS